MTSQVNASQDVVIVDGGTSANQAAVTAAGALKVDASAAGGGTVIANQGAANTKANAWPVGITDNSGNGFAQVVSSARSSSLLGLVGFPPGSSILAGSASADAATIVSIPGNMGFVGQILLSGSVVVAAGAAAGINALPNVTVQGAGAVPATGTKVAQLAISVGANVAGALNSSDNSDAATIWVFVLAPAGGCTLQLNFGSATAASASVSGYTL